MFRWLEAVIRQRNSSSSSKSLRDLDQRSGWLAFIKTQKTETTDSFGLRTFEVVDARIQKQKGSAAEKWQPAGWLPNRAIAEQWLSFVRENKHPILPVR